MASVTSEHTFFALQWLENYPTMNQDELNNCLLIHCHKLVTDALVTVPTNNTNDILRNLSMGMCYSPHCLLPLVYVPSLKRFKRGPSLELFCRVWEMSWSIIWFQNYFCWRQIDALYCPRVRAPIILILSSFESVGTTISSQIIVYRCRLWEVPFPFSVFWKLVSIFSTFSWRQQCNTAQHLDFYKGASLLGINLKIHSNTKESWVRVDVHILFLLSLPGVHEGGVEGCRGNL